MGLGSFLFGSAGGYPSWYKKDAKGLFEQYMAALQGAFSQQGHQQRVGNYREGVQQQMQNSADLGNRNLKTRGFRGGGNGLFDLSLANMVSDFDQNDWFKSQQGMLSGLQGGGGLLQAAGQAGFKQPTGGLMQMGLSLASSALPGMGQMFKGGGGGGGFNGMANGWMPIEDQDPFKTMNPFAQQDQFGNWV